MSTLASTVAAGLEGPIAAVLDRHGITPTEAMVRDLARTTAVVVFSELCAQEAGTTVTARPDVVLSARDHHIQTALAYQDAASELFPGLPGSPERRM